MKLIFAITIVLFISGFYHPIFHLAMGVFGICGGAFTLRSLYKDLEETEILDSLPKLKANGERLTRDETLLHMENIAKVKKHLDTNLARAKENLCL